MNAEEIYIFWVAKCILSARFSIQECDWLRGVQEAHACP